MTFYSLFLISLALALDAFGVALSLGLLDNIKTKNKVAFIVSFAFFQFLLSLIGAYFGYLFNIYIVSVPKIIGGIIIAVVGVMMIKEGMEEKETNLMLKKKMYFILGISVSIDAAVVGFTALNNVGSFATLFEYTLFIGFVTLVMSSIAFIISKSLKKIEVISKYADYVGGITLILFGLKMMFL